MIEIEICKEMIGYVHVNILLVACSHEKYFVRYFVKYSSISPSSNGA